MHDDRIEADPVQKGEGGRDGCELIAHDPPADLDHGEFLRVDGAVVAKVFVDLLPSADVAEELADDVSCRAAGHRDLSSRLGR